MSDRSLVAPIALGIALTGVTGVCLYLLLRKDEEWSNENSSHITSRHVVLEVKIPKDSVGLVIGRQGANIREIQAKTETRINFRDELETEEYRVAAIRGSPDGAQLAEILIHQTLAQQPRVETVVMEVPSRNVGRVIGRRGETVKAISRASRCKVEVEPETKAYETKIILRGSSDSIESARNMIMEKVREAQALDLRDGFDDFDMFTGPPVAEDAAIKAGGEARPPRLKYQQPLFFKTPKEAMLGNYVDKKCPFTGSVRIRGRIMQGVVKKCAMKRSITLQRNYLHYVPKYRRFEKRRKTYLAHCSPCFRLNIGDTVKVGECRPLSKNIRFNVIAIVRRASKSQALKKF